MNSAWKITRSQVTQFLNSLINRFEVFAPTHRGKQYIFSKITRPEEAVLDYDTTILPPKKFFLPPREILFNYAAPGLEPIMPEPEEKPRVIFGVHTYDLHGIGVLKKIFLGAEQPDPYFAAMYDRTYLVGVDHRDDEFKFARDMKSDGLNCEYDLFLGNYGPDFLLLMGRENGKELLSGFKESLVPIPNAEIDAYLKQRELELGKTKRKLVVDMEEFPYIFPVIQDSIIWQQEADKCFSCGSCNTTCPTCYCFDIRDVPDIDTAGGKRMRFWDSCLLDVFAKVATGENFREKTHSRLKHRFNRKIWYLKDLYGRTACVGCGRCSRACKAEINIIKVLNRLKEDYNVACSINS
jgi:ferredoxin